MSQVFTHTPRPAIAEVAPYERQRRYGADRNSALRGLRDKGGECRVQVFRHAPDATAELDLETSNVWMRVQLPPEALRELARCLIDAAADIDGKARVPVHKYTLGNGVYLARGESDSPLSALGFEVAAHGQSFAVEPTHGRRVHATETGTLQQMESLGLPMRPVIATYTKRAELAAMETAILSLPQGAGKNLIASELAQRLGCTHIVDEWREGMPVLPGALHLHQSDGEGAA